MALSAVIANLITRLSIDAADFDDGIKQAQKRLTNVGSSLTRLGSDLTQTITLPLVAAGGAVVKFGSDFESAFTGVIKTVEDAADAQGKLTAVGEKLRQGLRDMAREIPVSVDALAGIAEQAGQLGIRSEDILKFTRTIADLGASTNLTFQEAATGSARFLGVMGESIDNVDRFGSSLSKLGNTIKGNESEILAMGLKISGVGRQLKLTSAETLGWSAALVETGIEAEAGGTAISRVFVEIEKSIALGSKTLSTFAAVADKTVPEFAELFKKDATQAMLAFLDGLQRVRESGQSVSVVLEALGLGNVRVSDTLKRLSSDAGRVAEVVSNSSKAWEENTALTEEAAKRYATFASQVQVLWQQLRDVFITLFDSIRPVLVNTVIPLFEDFVKVLAQAATAFSQLPQPVQASALAFLALFAAAGPVLVLAGKLVFSYKNIISLFGSFAAPAAAAAAATGEVGAAATATAASTGLLSTAWGSLSGSGSALLGVLTGPVGLIALAAGLELAIVELTGNTQGMMVVWGNLKSVGDSLLGLFEQLWRSSINLASAFIQDAQAAEAFRLAFSSLSNVITVFTTIGSILIRERMEELNDLFIRIADKIDAVTALLPGHSNSVRATGMVYAEAGASAKLLKTEVENNAPPLLNLNGLLGQTKTKIDSLKESFLSSLNPLRDLNKDIADLTKKGFDAKQIAIVYRDRLVDAAKAEEEAAKWAKILGIELPATQLNAAAQAALNYAIELDKIKERQRLVAESNARLNAAFKNGTALAHANLDATLRVAEGQHLFSDRTIQVYQDLERQRRQMQANITSLAEFAELGYNAEDALKALGISTNEMRESSRFLGVELDETTKAFLRQADEIEASRRLAEKWSADWRNAFTGAVDTFRRGLSDMIFEGKSFSSTIKETFKGLAKSIVDILTERLFQPVKQLFANLGGILANGLTGLLSGQGGSGFNFGSLFQGVGFGNQGQGGFNPFGGGGGGTASQGGLIGSLIGLFTSGGAAVNTAAAGLVPSSLLLPLPFVPGSVAAGAAAGGGTGAAAGAAAGSSPFASLGAFFTNPWTIAIGAALGAAIFVWRKWFVRNIGDVAKDIQRDFAIALDTNTLKRFAQSVNVTEDTFKKFTKSISLSPAFFKFALDAGVSADALIAAFSDFSALGVEHRNWGAAAAAAAAGDYSQLNAAWLGLFQNSDQLQAALGGSFDRLLDHTTAARDAADAVDNVTDAAGDAAGNVDSLGDSVDNLVDSLTEATNATFNLAEAISDPQFANVSERLSSSYAAAQALNPVSGGRFGDVRAAALQVFDEFGAEALQASVNSLLSGGFRGPAAAALLAAALPTDEPGAPVASGGRGRNPVTALDGYNDTSRTPEDSPGPAIDALGDRIVDAIRGNGGDIVINVDGEEIGRIAATYIQRDVGRVGSGFTQAIIRAIIANQGGVS